MLILLLAACEQPIVAPDDLDGLAHWLFANYTSATDEEIRVAATNLGPLVAEQSRGLISDLTDEEQGTVALDVPRDPADATGMFVAGPVACTHGDMEKVHYALDQKGLYEAATGDEQYITYSRAYTTDFAAYEARTEAYLGWHTTYKVKPVVSEYTADIDGGMRFVPEADGVGPIVIERAVLPAPAVFTDADTEDFFDQDYQLDVMLPDSSAEGGDGTKHIYVAWRDLESVSLPDESDIAQGLMLDGFEDFDRDTELVCAAGGF